MKDLLRIQYDPSGKGGTSINCDICGENESFALSMSLYSLFLQNKDLFLAVASVASIMHDNPSLKSQLMDNTVTAPDFDAILKNSK